VAVVQISKIQVRRGQKNSGIGVPQLSSAEFAWAVDTQELFIGNGSVAEGAPYVGNTKILTEHDNILELASSYRFTGENSEIVNSTFRPLQSKLDEYVSVLDFGAVPDGSTDCVQAFENAFQDLFENSNGDFKKILLVPNGTYLLNSDLRIPSTAIIVGENKQKTVLDIGPNNILFVTEDGLGIGDFTSGNRPEYIHISNLTVKRTSGQMVISGVKDSTFESIRFVGDYELGDAVGIISTRPASVSWENDLLGIRVDNILFDHCVFEYTPLAVKCVQRDIFDTRVEFDHCGFFVCETGIYVEGTIGQGTIWNINDCRFDQIYSQAFLSTQGRGTLISRSTFENCGNHSSAANSPEEHIIEFGDSFGNVVKDCSFNRHQAASIVSFNTIAAIGEVSNSNKTDLIDRNYSQIFLSDSFRPLAVFSALNRFIKIDYTLILNGHTRKGILELAIDQDLSTISIADHYGYSALTPSAPGGALMTNFEFSVELRDNDLDSGIETVVLYYRNPLSVGFPGHITYSISYGV
jgi:hypothetical protein